MKLRLFVYFAILFLTIFLYLFSAKQIAAQVCTPTLFSPLNGAVIQLSGDTGSVALRWTLCSEINDYQLYWTKKQVGCFLGVETGQLTGIIAGNTYNLNVGGETAYTWKARSCPLSSEDPNCPGGSGWSSTWSFTTKSNPTPTPCATNTPTPAP